MQLNIILINLYTGFDCSKAAKVLREKFSELSNLSYRSISTGLFANHVITLQERLEIESLIGDKQMQRVLTILLDSLGDDDSAKYSGFLSVMERSGDILLEKEAKELRQ